MAARSQPMIRLLGLSLVALTVTLFTHAAIVIRYLPGSFTRALPILAIGWASFGLVFYSLGRLRPVSTGRMPNMRTTEVGVALFLFSVVLGGLLDSAGLSLAEATEFHFLPAAGIYVGLALTGWGFGARTRTVNEVTGESG